MYGYRYTDPDDPRHERRRHWAGTATAIVLVTAVAAGLAIWTVRNADELTSTQTADRAPITEPAVRRDEDVTVRRDDNFAAAPLARPDLYDGGAGGGAAGEAAVPPGGDMGVAGVEGGIGAPAPNAEGAGVAGNEGGLAPAGFDPGPIAPVPEAQAPRTAAEEMLALEAERAADWGPIEGGAAVAPDGGNNVAVMPEGRDFDFQALPPAIEPPAGGGMMAEGAITPPPAMAGAGAAPLGEVVPPAEVAAAEDIGQAPEGRKLENEHDILAAEIGGQEATVKGKIDKLDAQARTLTLDNGDTYVLADNTKIGIGNQTIDDFKVGTEVQVVFRTDADHKVVTSLTLLTGEGNLGGGDIAPAAFDRPMEGAALEGGAAGNVGQTPEARQLENQHDVLAADIGGQEATVKGKIDKLDPQARTLTLDNGDTYVLADNTKIGVGDQTLDDFKVGTEVQVVFRTGADHKVVTSLTLLTGEGGGELAPAAFDRPIPEGEGQIDRMNPPGGEPMRLD